MISKAQSHQGGLKTIWLMDSSPLTANMTQLIWMAGCSLPLLLIFRPPVQSCPFSQGCSKRTPFPMKTMVRRSHSELCFIDKWKEKARLMVHTFNTDFTTSPPPPLQSHQKRTDKKCYSISTEKSSKPSESFKLLRLGSSKIFYIKWWYILYFLYYFLSYPQMSIVLAN